MSDATAMTIKPRMSEKAYALSKEQGTYVFVVPKTANKVTVAAAVEAQFGVTVETVNISNTIGKPKRSYRRGGRPLVGKNVDIKKAYVRLKAGDSIAVFAAVDEEEAKAEKTADTLQKVADKKAKKDAKVDAKKESK
ncbi:MAG: 50S ribosomal protein L23 [Candidatus Saccharimonadales bacterium]